MDIALVLFETTSSFRTELQTILNDFEIIFNESNNTDSLDAEIAKRITVIFGSPKIDFLKLCPQLIWLQLQSAGTDGYIKGDIKENILLCCATGAYGHSVSEHMLALTFSLLKKLHLYRDVQSFQHWESQGEVHSIQGAVTLVVGLGDIGTAYAKKMKALGSYVIGIRRTAHKKPDYLDELLLPEQMMESLPRADIVALIVPRTKETVGLFGQSEFAKMKKGSFIINAGRGSAIDTDALFDALDSGFLGGAGLDVTDPEPLPPEHKLWKQKNLIITPHVAGGRYMRETSEYIMKLNLENARRFIKGERLLSLVDYKTGYRIPLD